MLHHLAGATIQVANLVNYNCHPQEDGNQAEILYKALANMEIQISSNSISSRTIVWIQLKLCGISGHQGNRESEIFSKSKMASMAIIQMIISNLTLCWIELKLGRFIVAK